MKPSPIRPVAGPGSGVQRGAVGQVPGAVGQVQVGSVGLQAGSAPGQGQVPASRLTPGPGPTKVTKPTTPARSRTGASPHSLVRNSQLVQQLAAHEAQLQQFQQQQQLQQQQHQQHQQQQQNLATNLSPDQDPNHVNQIHPQLQAQLQLQHQQAQEHDLHSHHLQQHQPDQTQDHLQHQQEQHQEPDIDQDSLKPDPSTYDDPTARMGTEEYAAAAAAAVMETGLGQPGSLNDGTGEPDVDAEMEDQDASAAANSGLGGHVDLSGAGMLGNPGAPGGVPQPSPQDHSQHQQHQHQQQQHQHHQQQQQQQQADMLQGLGQPQAHSHQHQHQPPVAPMGQPQQMQPSPHQHSMDPQLSKSTEDMAHESGYGQLNVESALAKRLAREPGHRLAQQRRPEQVLNLARRSNVEALFAHIAGEPARVPCKNCHKGHGPWTSCIVVDGQMCGSCANCWFNASGARCSFHETRNPQNSQQQQHNAAILPNGANGGINISADPNAFRFGTPHPLGTHAALAAPAPVSAIAPAAPSMSNPMLQHMLNRALSEVRSADKATRQLILMECAAKKLALKMVDYEELISSQEQSGNAGGPGQQGLGEDAGA
ncbi:hypothetical protein QR685DRAFT_434735 [Neurospora intermedia]|uniref:IBR domain-containing protein n=1 Tax=Neurospora intermedia TaxID=5142 RepID=A0ABR3DKQ2_NEUIN